MTVDICSIMYNEEVLLPYWIEGWLSVPWINEIYLVDGGSSDRSLEIAKSYDRVNTIVVPWRNDFARQRNIAIKRSRSNVRWIIQPDIDEIPCGNLTGVRIGAALEEQNINQLALPYVKFYSWDKLWFFNNGCTPSLGPKLVQCGYKSTMTVFKKGHLKGYGKSLHEMPIFFGEQKRLNIGQFSALKDLGKEFLIGHYDQAKHFEEAKLRGTSVETEMGLKRARYRLISPATYSGKVYDKKWAQEALKPGNESMIEELGKEQLKSFMNEHFILEDYDAFGLNHDIIQKRCHRDG